MIGVRHEDKSRWETRVPLIPGDIATLRRDQRVEFKVESSPTRAFPDADFLRAGATVSADIGDCPIILGVKEIPPEKLLPEKTYVFFSHTIKGQEYNVPLLRRLMELKCQLIDYERIVDEKGRRLVFFGRFAGLAGMIDTLWALGQRFKYEGLETPFEVIRQAYLYKGVDEAKAEIAQVGERIKTHGLPEACQPLVCGFAGYGQVSKGAQEIYDLLPVRQVSPADLPSVRPAGNVCYKAEFYEKDMVERIEARSPFDLQEYYDYPERYRGVFAGYLPHLTVLVTGIYWEPQYPRLVTFESLGHLFGHGAQPRLRVIGDISCDVEGAVQCTLRMTEPDSPVFVYDPNTGKATDGVAGKGPLILAVDHLPCELPVDASISFSKSLSPFVPALDRANFRAPLAASGLPPELIRATIVYQGELTEPYRYLEEFLAK
jgi:saccharopine dehydrogenase (NAD+, L-lysine-forming)